MKPFLLRSVLFLLASLAVSAQQPAAPAESHHAFATQILQRMRLNETDKTERLIAATTEYLTALEKILNHRQAVLDKLDVAAGPQGEPDEAQVTAIWAKTKAAYVPLRNAYVDKLEAELHPFLVDRIKDGLTNDALPRIHAMYLEMVPKLTPAEKAHVFGLLVEARENAICAIGAKPQRQWFDKYRGIANNYIAAQGHDFPALSKAWNAIHGELR